MLPRKPSDGLYTYNFDLDFMLLTISNPVTSAILSQTKYHANLVLTLRQYKGALAGRTKSAEIGYLLILHSGIHAIVRLMSSHIGVDTLHASLTTRKFAGKDRPQEIADSGLGKRDTGLQDSV